MRKQPLPSAEELAYIRDEIVLPIIIDRIASDMETIEHTPARLRMREVYLRYIDRLHDRVHKDLVRARDALRKSGIKIYEVHDDGITVSYAYKIRGYHSNGSMLWWRIEAVIAEMMQKYIEELTEPKETFENEK